MRSRWVGLLFALLAFAALAPRADAKKFRYASGPKAPEDTVLSVANPYLEPVVRNRGPRVPYTNLQMTQLVADSAAGRVLAGAPLESGQRTVLAPAREHPMNFVMEHALLTQLARRGIEVTVRHTPVPDDSLSTLFGGARDPVLEYTVGSAKITYLRLVGWLPGRVKVERQALIQGSVSLRDPTNSHVLWTADLAQNFVDRFSKSDASLVMDAHYPELKDDLPGRGVDKLVEPVIVVGVVGGLVALFFQNRP